MQGKKSEDDLIKSLETSVRDTTNLENISPGELELLISEYIAEMSKSKNIEGMMKVIVDDVHDVIELIRRAKETHKWSDYAWIIDDLDKMLVKYDKQVAIAMIMLSFFFA
jgi:hypothetical protein